MSVHYDDYLKTLDVLRERRSLPDWKAEDDREDMMTLEDLYDRMSPEERDLVEDQSSRAWPDLWDESSETQLRRR